MNTQGLAHEYLIHQNGAKCKQRNTLNFLKEKVRPTPHCSRESCLFSFVYFSNLKRGDWNSTRIANDLERYPCVLIGHRYKICFLIYHEWHWRRYTHCRKPIGTWKDTACKFSFYGYPQFLLIMFQIINKWRKKSDHPKWYYDEQSC